MLECRLKWHVVWVSGRMVHMAALKVLCWVFSVAVVLRNRKDHHSAWSLIRDQKGWTQTFLPFSYWMPANVQFCLLPCRFSGVFPSVNAAIKRRDQALQVWRSLLKEWFSCYYNEQYYDVKKSVIICLLFIFYLVFLLFFIEGLPEIPSKSTEASRKRENATNSS